MNPLFTWLKDSMLVPITASDGRRAVLVPVYWPNGWHTDHKVWPLEAQRSEPAPSGDAAHKTPPNPAAAQLEGGER